MAVYTYGRKNRMISPKIANPSLPSALWCGYHRRGRNLFAAWQGGGLRCPHRTRPDRPVRGLS